MEDCAKDKLLAIYNKHKDKYDYNRLCKEAQVELEFCTKLADKVDCDLFKKAKKYLDDYDIKLFQKVKSLIDIHFLGLTPNKTNLKDVHDLRDEINKKYPLLRYLPVGRCVDDAVEYINLIGEKDD